jgi:hypothetical protein
MFVSRVRSTMVELNMKKLKRRSKSGNWKEILKGS